MTIAARLSLRPLYAFTKPASANILWTGIARLASFAVPLIVARRFGATVETDAFFLALGATNFFVSIVGVVLEQVVVPHAAEARRTPGQLVAWLRSMAQGASLAGVVATLVGFIAIRGALRLQGGADGVVLFGLGPSAGAAAIAGVVILSSLASGVLTAWGRYFLVCGGLLLRAVTIGATVLLAPAGQPIAALLVGFLLGEVVRLVFVSACVIRTVRTLHAGATDVTLAGSPVRQVWISLWPVSLSMCAAALVPIIDRLVAATVVQGGVSVVEYGEKAYFAFVGTVVAGLHITALARWSQAIEAKVVWRELREIALPAAGIGILLTPAFLWGGGIAAPILMGKSLVARFGDAGILVSLYLVAVVPYTVGGFATRALIALKATKPIVVLGVIKLVANLIGDIVLARSFGLPGIPLASVVAESLVAGVAFLYVRWEAHER